MLYDPKWDVTPTTKDILLKAADLIREYGLTKYHRGGNGEGFCIHGAISMAVTGEVYGGRESDTRQYCRLVKKYAKSKGIDTFNTYDNYGMADWNNRPERTKEDVIALLEDTANAL
jgi:hypothetical protein